MGDETAHNLAKAIDEKINLLKVQTIELVKVQMENLDSSQIHYTKRLSDKTKEFIKLNPYCIRYHEYSFKITEPSLVKHSVSKSFLDMKVQTPNSNNQANSNDWYNDSKLCFEKLRAVSNCKDWVNFYISVFGDYNEKIWIGIDEGI